MTAANAVSRWWSMTNLAKAAAFARRASDRKRGRCVAAEAQPSATVVEFENPLASPQPLQGYLRQPSGAGPSPAVVLLHSCNGNWQRLDERWGKRIAAWGYVTLTVDSFGPRGLTNTCSSGAPVDLALRRVPGAEFSGAAAIRRSRRVSPCSDFRKAAGWRSLRSSAASVEQTSPNKFRAAIAFYPPLPRLQGQHDRADADPDRRARRLDLGERVPQYGGRPGRLGNIAARVTRASRSSSSSIPAPTTASTRPTSRRRFNFSGITSNSTSRQRTNRSTRAPGIPRRDDRQTREQDN